MWEFLSGVLDEVSEDALIIVADEDYLLDTVDLSDSGQVVPDDRVACNIEEWLSWLV